MQSNIPRRRLLVSAALAAGGVFGLAACGATSTVTTATSSHAATVEATSATARSAGPLTSAQTSVVSTAAPTKEPAPTSTSSQASQTPARGSQGSASVSPTGVTAAAPAKATGAVQFWQYAPPFVSAFATLTKAFNQTHQMPVAASMPSGYWEKVVVSEASGTGPDVFYGDTAYFKVLAHNGNIADVSAYAQTDKGASANLAAMYPALVEFHTYNGKLMAAPFNLTAGVVTFHTDELQAAGLPSPNTLGKQWDWNALRKYATQLVQMQGNTVKRAGLFIRTTLEEGYYGFCVANGGSFFNATLDQCIIASPEAIAGLEFAVNLVRDGVAVASSGSFWTAEASKYQQTAEGAIPSAFLYSELAMSYAGDWFNAWYIKDHLQQWDETIFPYSPTTGKTVNTSNLVGVYLNPASRVKDDAWAWMAYLMTPAVQDQIPTLFQQTPGNSAAAAAFALDPAKAGPPDGRRFLQPELDATVSLPASDWIAWSDISKAAQGQALTDAFTGKLSSTDALKQVQDIVNGIIAANKRKGGVSVT
jgi:ABC-type glycerol-3-phosphate transport system substrate-binding protein